MGVVIKAIDFYLPNQLCSNENIADSHPEWDLEKITSKIGITSRRYASKDEFSLELGICAAKKLMENYNIDSKTIDFILFCTQTPKFLVPANACFVHQVLALDQQVGALDINQGCSGYVYSLMLAESLIAQCRAKNILLITADTYTKLIAKENRSLLPIFGDAASASLITYEEGSHGIHYFEYGTNGSGAENLISPNSGMKGIMSNEVYSPDLYMNGSAIFNFTLEVIPKLVEKLLNKANLTQKQIDCFVFHQANSYMLKHLREKMDIDEKRFIIDVADTGNTVSSSIPIVLQKALVTNRIKKGDKVMLVGFGVGLSWAGCLLEI